MTGRVERVARIADEPLNAREALAYLAGVDAERKRVLHLIAELELIDFCAYGGCFKCRYHSFGPLTRKIKEGRE